MGRDAWILVLVVLAIMAEVKEGDVEAHPGSDNLWHLKEDVKAHSQ